MSCSLFNILLEMLMETVWWRNLSITGFKKLKKEAMSRVSRVIVDNTKISNQNHSTTEKTTTI